MEITTEVKVYRVKLVCDTCKEGYMVPTGTGIMTTSIQFLHKCTKCNKLENYTEQYPKTIYKELDNEEGSSNHN